MSGIMVWLLATAAASSIDGETARDSHAGTLLTGKPKVVFHAEGSPGFLTFEGVTRSLQFAEEGDTWTFSVPMDDVQTGIALRDQHMREKYVQTDQFPTVTLVVDRNELVLPEAKGQHEGTLTGTFTAHGVPQTVSVTYTVRERKGTFAIDATFPFDTSAHGIDIPSYLGVTIRPAMTAEVAFTLLP